MINVKSEIGNLKKVLLHRPGRELEHLIPRDMGNLLFDDIPYLKPAQQEHDYFAKCLRDHGCEVVYLENLLAETLSSDCELKRQFIKDFIAESGEKAYFYEQILAELLEQISDINELIDVTMRGITMAQLGKLDLSPLSYQIKSEHDFVLDPIPNLYFTRDAFSFIGKGVSINHMYSETRRRETLFGEYIFNYHRDFAGKVKQYYGRHEMSNLEGGDILVLSDKVVMVGVSQRTSAKGVEELARRLFADTEASYERVIAFLMPNARAFMHLDTVCTQIDRNMFIIHPGIIGNIRLFELRPDSNSLSKLKVKELTGSLDQVFAHILDLDQVHFIQCGGQDSVASQREQWSDGSNTLCISPGKVLVYDRNYISNHILREHNIEVIELPSAELSRGRGGPHCMSMPMWREDYWI